MLSRYAKLHRTSLQALAELRAEDALALLQAGRFQASYYLMGYAVECALKACIAAGTREHDFPDRELARKVHTHDLKLLLDTAGLEVALESDMKRSPEFEMHWILVRDWDPGARYDLGITAEEAGSFCAACTDGESGVLVWIKRRW